VRARAVRARRDDRLEGGRLRAELVEEPVETPSQVAFGAADEALLGEARVRLARDLARVARRVQLAFVLDCAQRFDEPAARDERKSPRLASA